MATLESQLMAVLNEYADELGEKVDKEFKDAGVRMSDELKKARGLTDWEYSKGWAYKKSGSGLNSEVVVYNRTKPGLTHLLEKGHVQYDINGRSHGRTRAFKHIEPVEEQGIQELMEKLNRDI